MNIKRLLQDKYLNAAKIASRLYPNASEADAKARLNKKINETYGQRLTEGDVSKIEIILEGIQ